MRKIVLLFGLISASAIAQQTPFHKQYYVNPFVINSSMAGLGPQMNLFLMHRSQWTSLPDSPITSTLTFDSPIIQGTNGVGVTLFADQTGIFRRNGGSANYSHQFSIDDKTKLYVGGGVNVFDNRIDFSKVEVVHAGDPYVFSTNQNKTIIDGNLGFNVKKSNLDFGVALNHLGKQKRRYQDLKNTAFYNQEWFSISTISYNFKIGEDWAVKPLLCFKYFDLSPSRIDLNAIATYKEKSWFAGTYRPGYGFSLAAGFRFYESITVGYSYDLITNNLRGNTGMSSEIIVGIRFGNKQKGPDKKDWVDTDGDGVSDEMDLEPNTPKGNLVNFQGKTIPNKTGENKTILNNDSKEVDSSTLMIIREQMAILQKDPISFFFDYDRAELKGFQDEKIVKLVRIMVLDTGATLTLYGNADSSGSDSYNMKLAARRARTVSDILVRDFKIDPSRIKTVSKGKRDPLAPHRTGVNRRVDADITPSYMKNVDENKKEESKTETETTIEESSTRELLDLFPINVDLANELIYTTQLGVFKNTHLENRWESISPVYQLNLDDGTTRYFSGIYSTEAEAEAKTDEVRVNGLTDSFTSAYYQGKRITMEKARELEKDKSITLTRRTK